MKRKGEYKKMKNFKNNKGITLVALIITIIVLLILAVVAISAVNGDGIISKAKIARKNYQDAQDEENLALEGYLTDIENANKNVGGTQQTVTTKAWTLTDSDSSGSITVGDLITNKAKTTEKFYVINVIGDKVSMLAAKNITTSGILEQSDSAPIVAFSSTNYWSSETSYPLNLNTYSIPDGTTSIITIAKAYGTSLGAKGRLMTFEEVESFGLGTNNSTLNCPSWISSVSYWLGTANASNIVCSAFSPANNISGITPDSTFLVPGVRPVIEVAVSSIE